MREFWYTSFHQLDLARQIVDGRRDAVRAYLHHFWSHWSGPNYAVDEARIAAYATETMPSPDDRLKTPASILWQVCDPIFPEAWSDRLDDFFTDYALERLPGVGHFMPLEATEKFAEAILHRIGS